MKVSVCLSLFLWLPLRMFPLRLMLPISLCTVFCPESQFSLGYSGFRRPKETFPKPNISHLHVPEFTCWSTSIWQNSLQALVGSLKASTTHWCTHTCSPANSPVSISNVMDWVIVTFQMMWSEETEMFHRKINE